MEWEEVDWKNVWNWDLKRYAHVFSHFSHVWLFATLWTVVCQGPLSMGFSRQEYRSGFPCPLPGDLPNPGIKPMSPESSALQADLYWWATGEALRRDVVSVNCSLMVIGVGVGGRTEETVARCEKVKEQRGQSVECPIPLLKFAYALFRGKQKMLQIHTLKWTHHLSKM